MANERSRVKLCIFADHISVKTMSYSEEPSILIVRPREGKTIWDALRSIINTIDKLAPSFIIGILEISFNKSMESDVLESLKKIYPELKSQNIKNLISKAINYLEKSLSGPVFDPRMN